MPNRDLWSLSRSTVRSTDLIGKATAHSWADSTFTILIFFPKIALQGWYLQLFPSSLIFLSTFPPRFSWCSHPLPLYLVGYPSHSLCFTLSNTSLPPCLSPILFSSPFLSLTMLSLSSFGIHMLLSPLLDSPCCNSSCSNGCSGIYMKAFIRVRVKIVLRQQTALTDATLIITNNSLQLQL